MTISAPLPFSLKIFHGLGSIAYGVKDSGFSTFLLLFYNQVVGIDAGIVGTAIMVALIVDAFADPIIGELSDRTRSRWGRRLPWLYAAPIPLALAWVALWNPPAIGQAMTVAWLIGFAIIVRALVSMCEVPSIALVPELTSDYHERTVVMRYRYLFGWGGGLVMAALAYGVFLAGPRGLTDPAGYFGYALAGAVMMASAVMISAAGQHKRIARPSPPRTEISPTIRIIAREMLRTLSNRAFLWLVAAALFAFVNQGMTFALINYLLGYVWQLDQGQMIGYVLILFGSMIGAFATVPTLSAKLGKRGGASLAGAISITINGTIYPSYVTGIFPGLPNEPSVPLMFTLVFFSNMCAIMMMILSSSMMADVVEASQEETGRRSEGLFFAGYFFMQKMATGIGIFIAGQILSFAAFPLAAKPGQVDAAVLHSLAMGYLIAFFVVGTIGLMILRHFPISRSDHDARLQLLDDSATTDVDAAGMHP
ncbi:MAG: MFS transporter [Sphingopyxis sp.]